MSTNVETMFYVGKAPWHSLGVRVLSTPDLQQVEKSACRFINAVSDFATHSKPLRKTANYKENLFAKTVEGKRNGGYVKYTL